MALGVLSVKEKIGNSNVVIIPADPIIKEEDIFVNTIKEAIKSTSETKNIVIVGIKPTRAETGYGYIKLDKNIKGNEYIVHKFVEKPDLENAKKFLEDGSYLWNSGMFIWDSESIRKEVFGRWKLFME